MMERTHATPDLTPPSADATLSRRHMVAAAGLATAAAATGALGGASAATDDAHAERGGGLAPSDGRPAALPDLAEARALVAPLAAGAALGRWRVVAVGPTTRGALSLALAGARGAFTLEVVRRDHDTSERAPGMSRHYTVLVANGGDGAVPTDEDHGLAAMALAEIILGNEAHLSDVGLLTQAERLQSHGAELCEHALPTGAAACGATTTSGGAGTRV